MSNAGHDRAIGYVLGNWEAKKRESEELIHRFEIRLGRL
jgi:hypothetical protein